MIEISAKGLIKYMEGDDVQRRRVLAAFKFPEVGKAPRTYYRDAIPAIRQHLQGTLTKAQMLARAEALVKEAATSTGGRHTRLMHNARGIIAFDEHFGDRGFRAMTSHRLSYVQGNVKVAVHPELWVMERNEQQIFKLELATEALSSRALETLAQLIYHAAMQHEVPISPKQAGVLEVATGEIHRGKKIGPRLGSRIAAALENIEALWPSIKRPPRSDKAPGIEPATLV